MGKTFKGKEKVKAKIAKAKAKINRKAKGMCACIAAFALAFVCGCMTPEQASRSTNATYGDMEAKVATDIGEKAHNNAVTVDIKVTIGDGAIASADSSGSTESQTQTPTFDISPKTDLRYNDAIAGASVASKNELSDIVGTGKDAVLAMMAAKQSGTVKVQKTDGTEAVVECKDGQCSFCEDCVVKQ